MQLRVFLLHVLKRTVLKQHGWSNMWHVHALASVLKHPIQSINPENNRRLRPVFNKFVMPRKAQVPPITS